MLPGGYPDQVCGWPGDMLLAFLQKVSHRMRESTCPDPSISVTWTQDAAKHRRLRALKHPVC